MESRRLAVSLVLGVLSLASVAVAAVHESPPSAMITIPPPRIGDVVSYRLESDGNATTATVTIAKGLPMQMPDGRAWETVYLEAIAGVGSLGVRVIHDASLDAVLGLAVLGDDRSESTGGVWPGLPVETRRMSNVSVEATLFLEQPIPAPDCVFAGLFPGQLRSGQGFELPPCGPWVTPWITPRSDARTTPFQIHGRLWEPRGQARLGNLTAFVFEGDGARLWFSDGFPYPVRMEHPAAGVMAMTAFAAGHEALGSPVPALGTRAPDLRWSARDGPLLMGGAVPGHPFPLEEAFAAALREPAVQAYVEAHPKAVVVAAHLDRERLPGRERWLWSLAVADEAVRGEQQAVQVQAWRDIVPELPALLGQAAATTDVRMDGERPVLLPQLPNGTLDVGSLLARADWQGIASTECQAYDVADIYFGAPGFSAGTCGRSLRAGLDTSGPYLSGEVVHDQLYVRFDGSDIGRMSYRVESRESPESPLAGAASPETRARPPTIVPGEPASWVPAAAGLGLVGLLGAALYYVWPHLKLLALGGFSRVQDATAHPRRQAILRLVRSEPGLHVKELGRRLGLPNGSLLHHLQVLERDGSVETRAEGGRRQVFPRGQAAARARAAGTTPLGPEAVAGIVRLHPGLTVGEVARKSGLAPSTVSYHVGRLRAAGRLRAERSGHALRLFPAA